VNIQDYELRKVRREFAIFGLAGIALYGLVICLLKFLIIPNANTKSLITLSLVPLIVPILLKPWASREGNKLTAELAAHGVDVPQDYATKYVAAVSTGNSNLIDMAKNYRRIHRVWAVVSLYAISFQVFVLFSLVIFEH
jgi:hypothetical protein